MFSNQKGIEKKVEKQITEYRDVTAGEMAISRQFNRLQVMLSDRKEMYEKVTDFVTEGLVNYQADLVRSKVVCGCCFDPVDEGCKFYN